MAIQTSTQNLSWLQKPIITLNDIKMASVLGNMINGFFEELDRYVTQNQDNDFLSYFLERTYLSIFINGIIRNDISGKVTCAQEYSITHSNGSFGRCDTFLNHDKEVFYIEAKLQQYTGDIADDHWDIESWMRWDDGIVRLQALKYFDTEAKYLNPEIYSNCYVMTLIFKVLKQKCPNEYFGIAVKNLPRDHKNSLGRDWFYSVAFINDLNDNLNGLEVYGTIGKYNKPQ